MKIRNVKELEKVIDLCRKKHLREITVDGVHFKLDDVPQATEVKENSEELKPNFGYTDDQIAEWSSGN